MELTASIGPLTFRLASTTIARPPDALPRPLLETEDGPVGVLEEQGRRFLLLDHRSVREGDDAARLELWLPLSGAEGGLEAAIVVCDVAVR